MTATDFDFQVTVKARSSEYVIADILFNHPDWKIEFTHNASRGVLQAEIRTDYNLVAARKVVIAVAVGFYELENLARVLRLLESELLGPNSICRRPWELAALQQNEAVEAAGGE